MRNEVRADIHYIMKLDNLGIAHIMGLNNYHKVFRCGLFIIQAMSIKMAEDPFHKL